MKFEVPQTPARTLHRRWLLLIVSLPVGVLLNTLTGGLDNLPQAVMTLMGWLNEPTFLQRHAARLIASLLVPTALAFIVLNLTPIGDWLVPNRLALAGLLAADGLLLTVAVGGLYLASIHEPPFLRGVIGDILGALLVTTFVVGLGSLAASTAWHRLLKTRPRAVAFCESLLQRV